MMIIVWIVFLTVANYLYLVKYKEFKKTMSFFGGKSKREHQGISLDVEDSFQDPFVKFFTIKVPCELLTSDYYRYHKDWKAKTVMLLKSIEGLLESKQTTIKEWEYEK